MLRKIGVESIISSDISDMENAEKLVLPGVITNVKYPNSPTAKSELKGVIVKRKG